MRKCDNCPKPNPHLEKCLNECLLSFDYEEIQQDLLVAIKAFYEHDIDLLIRNVNEVCITSHIFHYFSMFFADKYHGYNIDPEYNRNGVGAKYYYGDRYAKPDLIIHKRNCNNHNLLYAEFKTCTEKHSDHDKEKIKKFTSKDFGIENGRNVKPYRFKYGVSVLLMENCVKMRWYINGGLETIERSISIKDFKKGTNSDL